MEWQHKHVPVILSGSEESHATGYEILRCRSEKDDRREPE